MDHEYVNSKHCKACASEYHREYSRRNKERIARRRRVHYAENREKRLDYQKAHYAENREKLLDYQKAHYAENREALVKKQRAYRAENREAIAERRAAYRAENREALVEQERSWRQRNPDKVRAKSHRRRATLAGVPQDGLVYELDAHCAVCYSTENLTEEHMVPISRGGSDTLGNKATFCKSCNSSKRDKSITDADFTVWLVKRRMT